MDEAAIRQRIKEIREYRQTLAMETARLQEQLQTAMIRIHQHDGAASALEDILSSRSEETT